MEQPEVYIVKKTALYDRHQSLGAKMVEFGGWEMPLHYGSILQEHKTVRNAAGIFDVSHMGRVSVEGPDAEKLLDHLSTNVIAGKKIGSAIYTIWCNEKGGSIDDLIVYKVDQDRFFVVFNASNREKDLNHLRLQVGDLQVMITDHYERGAILAVQGPHVRDLLAEFFPSLQAMGSMQVQPIVWNQFPLYLATTGYTGVGGCEICGDQEPIVALWDQLMARGIAPCGLGARDTLRLEMGYALYGHEISETIAPTESVCRWAVKMKKENFVGRAALEVLESTRRFPAALLVKERGIAREGDSVVLDDSIIGRVTSGSFSPMLSKGIALALVDRYLEAGTSLSVEVRGQKLSVEVVGLPFISL